MSGNGASSGRAVADKSADRRTVFVSYDAADTVVAQKLRTHLEEAGYPCFLPAKTGSDEDLGASVKRAIDSSSCLVLILSDRSNHSETVRDEVEAAYRQGKPIFPLRIDETLPSTQLELFVSAKHWIDAWQGTTRGPCGAPCARAVGRTGCSWRASVLRLVPAASVATCGAGARCRGRGCCRDQCFPAGEERLPELPDASYAASFGLTGGYILPGKSNEVSYSIQDANTKGTFTPIGALAHMGELEIYNVIDPANPLLVHKGEAANFSGQYGASLRHKLTFEGLPAILVACLGYQRSDDSAYETVLQAFGFMAAGEIYGHASFDSVSIGEKRALRGDAPIRCASALTSYVDEEIDRSAFEDKVRAAAKLADTGQSPSIKPAPAATPQPVAPAPLSARDNIVGTLVFAGAFSKSFCRGAAFAVTPNLEGVAEFKRKHAVTDAELQAATALWEPQFRTLDERMFGPSCIGLLENYVAHGLVVRTSSTPLTYSPAIPRAEITPRP